MMRGNVIIRKVRKLVRSERGGALAELAIMAPFLALMLAVVCEVGRYFENYTTLAKGTRAAARYLSNHNLTKPELDRAANLVVCGKLACAGGDELIKGVAGGAAFSASNVCIESPAAKTIVVRIARANDCVPVANAPAGNPYNYQPVFRIGAFLNQPSLDLAVPITPRTSMFKSI